MFQQDHLPELIDAYENYLDTNELGKVYSAILTDICFGIPTHKILKKKRREVLWVFILNAK